jgi:hypothetical protein
MDGRPVVLRAVFGHRDPLCVFSVHRKENLYDKQRQLRCSAQDLHM